MSTKHWGRVSEAMDSQLVDLSSVTTVTIMSPRSLGRVRKDMGQTAGCHGQESHCTLGHVQCKMAALEQGVHVL